MFHIAVIIFKRPVSDQLPTASQNTLAGTSGRAGKLNVVIPTIPKILCSFPLPMSAASHLVDTSTFVMMGGTLVSHMGRVVFGATVIDAASLSV